MPWLNRILWLKTIIKWFRFLFPAFRENVILPYYFKTEVTLKNIRYFTNGVDTIEWNQEECMHSGKCLKNIPYIIDKPGTYSISVSERQFNEILDRAEFCPSRALKLKCRG